MQLFQNTVKLRGFLGRDAEVPTSDRITDQSFSSLTLGTVSDIWDLGANEWRPHTDWHRIICPGPYFCGLTRGMRRGDYLEVEGELRMRQQERRVGVAGERFSVHHGSYAVHAIRITRFDRLDVLVDLSDSDGHSEQRSNGEVEP
jgi:single-stranded DNA-binding protein